MKHTIDSKGGIMKTYYFKVTDIDGQTSVIKVKSENELQAELITRQEISGLIKIKRTFDANLTASPDFELGLRQ